MKLASEGYQINWQKCSNFSSQVNNKAETNLRQQKPSESTINVSFLVVLIAQKERENKYI